MTEKTKIKDKEMDKLAKQFDEFDHQVKDLTLDQMNKAPVEETEPQTKISQKELDKTKEIYLKYDKRIDDRQKFNEDYRKEWEFEKEYVKFIAEHKEIIGETIELWTHPRGGVGAEFWKVPTNKPVWGPRYLAEQIRNCTYHRLVMQPSVTADHGNTQFYGSMVADTTIPRLTCEPVSTRKSIFMGKAA